MPKPTPDEARAMRAKLGPNLIKRGLWASDAVLAASDALDGELAAVYKRAAHYLRQCEHTINNTTETDPDYDQ